MNVINKIALKNSNLWPNFTVLALLFRCFNLCSSYTIFHEELEKFKSIMIHNGYPIKFLNNFLSNSVTKRVLLFTLPFTGQHSSDSQTSC